MSQDNHKEFNPGWDWYSGAAALICGIVFLLCGTCTENRTKAPPPQQSAFEFQKTIDSMDHRMDSVIRERSMQPVMHPPRGWNKKIDSMLDYEEAVQRYEDSFRRSLPSLPEDIMKVYMEFDSELRGRSRFNYQPHE